jgi:hypothetical protein
MTDEKLKGNLPLLPFVFRFAETIPDQTPNPLRYDLQRQISQTLIAGEWVDTCEGPSELLAGTRITAVRRETTDDA